jgi:hypothetical protein
MGGQGKDRGVRLIECAYRIGAGEAGCSGEADSDRAAISQSLAAITLGCQWKLIAP